MFFCSIYIVLFCCFRFQLGKKKKKRCDLSENSSGIYRIYFNQSNLASKLPESVYVIHRISAVNVHNRDCNHPLEHSNQLSHGLSPFLVAVSISIPREIQRLQQNP